MPVRSAEYWLESGETAGDLAESVPHFQPQGLQRDVTRLHQNEFYFIALRNSASDSAFQ